MPSSGLREGRKSERFCRTSRKNRCLTASREFRGNAARLPRSKLAGGPGFEPRLTESESAVLPLNYPPPKPLKPFAFFGEFFNPGRRFFNPRPWWRSDRGFFGCRQPCLRIQKPAMFRGGLDLIGNLQARMPITPWSTVMRSASFRPSKEASPVPWPSPNWFGL